MGARPSELLAATESVDALVRETEEQSAGSLVIDEHSPAWLRQAKRAGL
jgi:hypothetical protein